jgi:predicted nucleic acid-binding Zn finger protein
MRILKTKEGTYKVESSSRKGKFYIVDLEKQTCSCPHFLLRLKRVHGMCKHIIAVKDKVEKRDTKSYGEIIGYVQKKGSVESLELIKKFSLDAVDDLLSRGELIEDRGRIRILK